jgi:hypothetical protein
MIDYKRKHKAQRIDKWEKHNSKNWLENNIKPELNVKNMVLALLKK